MDGELYVFDCLPRKGCKEQGRAPGRAVLLNVKLICRSVPIATCTKLGSKYVETVARRQGVSDCGVATVEFHATQCFL